MGSESRGIDQRRADLGLTRSPLGRPTGSGEEGTALVATMVTFAALAGLVIAAVQTSSVELDSARHSIDDVRAASLAESGIEVAKAQLAAAAKRTSVHDPLDGVRSMFDTGTFDVDGLPILGQNVMLADATPLMSDGANVGEYTTSASVLSSTAREVVIEIVSTGYVPVAPQNLRPGEALESWDSITVSLSYEVDSSSVFDNAYFVNNWGWLYGNTITVNGNARSNGQMDIGGYRPKITGQPLYDSLSWDGSTAVLGAQTGEGGLSSAWDVVNASNVQGTGSGGVNQESFLEPVEMPNLTDLSRYEQLALSENSTITIDGVVVASGVVGDTFGEAENLYLIGTRNNPIELNGPVVVRGDVIISGYVTGQGSIYSGGNTYVPDSIEYSDGPTSGRPALNSRQATEQWIERSMDKDFLGLFASENIIIGDFTDRTWSYYVGHWLGSDQNSSHEDAGTDLIPHTSKGRDGIAGTADDDSLEGDGVFSVEYYTAADEAAGTIPEGFHVDDPIPGTGEDIDGDGQFDDTLTVADFQIEDPLNTGLWEGNMPSAGIRDYSDIASMSANHLDGVFYTNHAFSWVVLGNQPAELNGSMIARNENIVYGTPQLQFNYDSRMIGGGGGLLGDMLPLTLRPVEMRQWRRNSEDPHRAVEIILAAADPVDEGGTDNSGSNDDDSSGSDDDDGNAGTDDSAGNSGSTGEPTTGTSGGRGRGRGNNRGNSVGRSRR